MEAGVLRSLLAFTPLVLAGVLLIGLRWPARRAMPAVLIVSVLIALFAWQVSAVRVLASGLQGLILTASILWIIFGAILLLNTLKHSAPSPPSAMASPASARTAASRP